MILPVDIVLTMTIFALQVNKKLYCFRIKTNWYDLLPKAWVGYSLLAGFTFISPSEDRVMPKHAPVVRCTKPWHSSMRNG